MLFHTSPYYSILFHTIPILFHTIPIVFQYYSNTIPILFHNIPTNMRIPRISMHFPHSGSRSDRDFWPLWWWAAGPQVDTCHIRVGAFCFPYLPEDRDPLEVDKNVTNVTCALFWSLKLLKCHMYEEICAMCRLMPSGKRVQYWICSMRYIIIMLYIRIYN